VAGRVAPIDVVFPVMHGPYGEDGSIQGFLEMAGVPYVGAGVLGSAVGMDKAVQKVLFEGAGIPVVEHLVLHEREWESDPGSVAARAASLGFPLFCKPAALGSSVGITKVDGPDALRPALEEAFRYGRKAVLERAVEGAREIECAVLGNDEPVASSRARSSLADTRFTITRPSISTSTAPSSSSPPRSHRRRSRRSSAWPSPRSERSTAPGWRASTSS
jgi:D-alanine-D-alanine ligase